MFPINSCFAVVANSDRWIATSDSCHLVTTKHLWRKREASYCKRMQNMLVQGVESITISSGGVVGICPLASMHQSTQHQLQLLTPPLLSLHRSSDLTSPAIHAAIRAFRRPKNDERRCWSTEWTLGRSVYANGQNLLQESRTLAASRPQAIATSYLSTACAST